MHILKQLTLASLIWTVGCAKTQDASSALDSSAITASADNLLTQIESAKAKDPEFAAKLEKAGSLQYTSLDNLAKANLSNNSFQVGGQTFSGLKTRYTALANSGAFAKLNKTALADEVKKAGLGTSAISRTEIEAAISTSMKILRGEKTDDAHGNAALSKLIMFMSAGETKGLGLDGEQQTCQRTQSALLEIVATGVACGAAAWAAYKMIGDVVSTGNYVLQGATEVCTVAQRAAKVSQAPNLPARKDTIQAMDDHWSGASQPQAKCQYESQDDLSY